MEKVRKAIGNYGEGVVVRYKGTNAENGKGSGIRAEALPSRAPKTKEMRIFENYFDQRHQTGSGYHLVHEMGHNTLGLSDKILANFAKPDGQNFFAFSDPDETLAYRWPGVDLAAKNGIIINDTFTCSVGFDEC